MEVIFNLFKVKYKKLDELITASCPDLTKDSKVNIFINFESIMKKLASSNVEEYLRVKQNERSYEMISNIVNFAMHYRKFFTNNKVYSRILFMFRIRLKQPIRIDC
jgi:hypothetical protein